MLHFENKAKYTLLTLVATKLLKEQPDSFDKGPIYECFNTSTSTQSYAKCLGPMLVKKITLNNILKYKFGRKKSLKKRFVNEKNIPLEDSSGQKFQADTSLSEDVAHFFTSLLKNIKQITGPWIKIPSVNENLSAKKKRNEIQSWLKKFLKSPLLVAKGEPHISDLQFVENLKKENENVDYVNDISEPNIRILSPRLMPFFKPVNQESLSILSPDFLSLYEGGSNSIASIPSLLNVMDKNDKTAWMDFFKELSGLTDTLEIMKSPEFKDILSRGKSSQKSQLDTTPYLDAAVPDSEFVKVDASSQRNVSDSSERFFLNDAFNVLANTVEDVLHVLTSKQIDDLNQVGYTFLNVDQINFIFKENVADLLFDLDEYSLKTDEEKETMLFKEILLMSDAQLGYKRVKRENANATILAPYIGGTVLTTYVGAPTILSPSVFSYIILGPLVLSPYILSPFLLSPFVLSPMVLTPLIFSPSLISPTVLSPVAFSPNVGSPLLLSPYILSPLVMSPSILSPSVLSPLILSPGVLSSAILSDGSLSPAILSPCILCKK